MIVKRAIFLLLLLLPAAASAQTPESDSRQIYQQATREPKGSQRALELYARYTQLEPDDAWGYLAYAEALATARRFDEAFAALDRAEKLAPGEGDVAIVRTRVNRLHRAALPTFKPNALVTRDSEGNTSGTFGAAGDVTIANGVRFGILGAHGVTGIDGVQGTLNRGAATLAVRTSALRWTTEVGAAQIMHDSSYAIPMGQSHLRWSKSARSPTVDVRVRRMPVTAAYSLLRAEALLTEARGLIDVPIGGPLKLRATGQLGSIEDRVNPAEPLPTGRRRNPRNTAAPYTETNQRVGFGGALVTNLTATSEFGVNGYRLSYEHEGSGNYFAPEYVDLLELSSYTEIYRFDPITISFDAGLGVQRAKPFFEAAGDITPAARLWAQVVMPLATYVEMAAEVDAYRSQMSTVATSSTWSSVSGGLSVRWLIR